LVVSPIALMPFSVNLIVVMKVAMGKLRLAGTSRSNDVGQDHFTECHFIHRQGTARPEEFRPPGAARRSPTSPSSVKTNPSQFGRFSVKTRPTSPVDLSSFGLDNFSGGREVSLIESEPLQKSVGRASDGDRFGIWFLLVTRIKPPTHRLSLLALVDWQGFCWGKCRGFHCRNASKEPNRGLVSWMRCWEHVTARQSVGDGRVCRQTLAGRRGNCLQRRYATELVRLRCKDFERLERPKIADFAVAG
jgi:hypothetical protein